MRMFLVAMCDIFLLLYLTAISAQDNRPKSRVTLSEFRRLEDEKSRQEKEQEALRLELAKYQAEKEELAKKAAEAEKLLLEVKRDEVSEAARIEELKKEKESAAKLAEEARLKAAEMERAAEEARKRALETAETANAAKLKAEEETRLALAAQAKALEEKERAEREAKLARANEKLAIEAATLAKQTAAEKERLALKNEAIARASKAQAEAAETRVKAQKQQLTAILKPAEKAFHENIGSHLAVVNVYLRRGGVFGDSERRISSLAIPVSHNKQNIYFQAAADISLDKKINRLKDIRISVDGVNVQEILLHPQKRLIGLVTLGSQVKSRMLNPDTTLMPTLMAIRNDSNTKFSDQIRDLDPVKLTLQRDKFRVSGGGRLVYQAEGIRGTGDYGEVIMQGDQIVDLEGNLLGVATDRNTVDTIGAISEWRSYKAPELLKLFSD